MDMYLLIFISVVLRFPTQQRNTEPRECLRKCLNRDREDGLSLSLHRRLLQTHPDLRLTQNVAASSCLTCRPMCWTAFSLTASECSVYAGQHTTACLQRPLGICETCYDARHLVCVLYKRSPPFASEHRYSAPCGISHLVEEYRHHG